MSRRGAPRSIAILSSAASGGAGIAARRLADAMRAHADAEVDFIDLRTLGEAVPEDVVPPDSFTNSTISDVHFTVEYPGFVRGWFVDAMARYDAINVHWAVRLVTLGELDALSRTGRTLVFTLHDFNHLSGGCHYPGPCAGLAQGCRACPQIDRSRAGADLPPRLRRIKGEIFARPNVELVAPSRFVRDAAVASGIVPAARAHVVRNPYEPAHSVPVRGGDGPPRILLVADNLAERRKNMRLALDVLAALRAAAPAGATPFVVDLIGAGAGEVGGHLRDNAVAFTAHGRVADHERMTAIFRDADVMLSTSLEDNWPNILVEAGVYGVVPVVGPGHGCEEFVRRYGFGAVSAEYTVTAFAEALQAALGACSAPNSAQSSVAASALIRQDHDGKVIAAQYLDVLRRAGG